MGWRFQPRDPNFGIPAGQVQQLDFLFVPEEVTLVKLLNLGEESEPGVGQTGLALVDLGTGQEPVSIVDVEAQWERVELAFMRFASRVASGHPPLMAARHTHPDRILREIVGEHFEALRITRVRRNGLVQLRTYPIPAGDHRAFLLIRAGGSAPS